MATRLRVWDRQAQRHVALHEITVNAVKIGREDGCDIVLDSRYVSAVHALIRRERDGVLMLESASETNPVEVSSRRLRLGERVPIEAGQDIRIANFSVYVEEDAVDPELGRDTLAAVGELELDLHKKLLERVDTRTTIEPAKFRDALDALVRERVPDWATTHVSRGVLDLVLRESFHGEIVQSIFLGAREHEAGKQATGFGADVDAGLAKLVQTFRRWIEVSGRADAVRRDLALVEERFPVVFERFLETASDEIKALLVRRHLVREIMNLVLGYGPLQDLLELPDVNDIMVVNKDLIYVERGGKIERLFRTFISEKLLEDVIQRIVETVGRQVNQSSPLVDARLKDGSRVNAIIRPLAVKGACLTIRKFSRIPLTIADLVRFGSLTPASVEFLKACIRARKNLVISGGTGSGKTSLLNILSGFIPDDERIVTIEDAAELQLRQTHVVTLETRPANVEGKGAYTIRDLVRNSLRMRPDRIIVGECRGGEALDMLQAMNTGHDGSLTTIHANSPEDALLRLETLVLEAAEIPIRAIRDQIEAAVQVIVQTQRLPSGRRAVTHISEIVGIDPVDHRILVNDVFEFRDDQLTFSGYLPTFIDELTSKARLVPATLFSTSPPPPARRRG